MLILFAWSFFFYLVVALQKKIHVELFTTKHREEIQPDSKVVYVCIVTFDEVILILYVCALVKGKIIDSNNAREPQCD